MEPHLKGACQKCGGRIEFPAESSGTFAPCPHCGHETRLKPGALGFDDPTLPEALLPELPEAADEPSPLRRPTVKVAIITGILVLLLVALIVAAEWLSHFKPPQRNHGNPPATNQVK